jgi:hypothetical protein
MDDTFSNLREDPLGQPMTGVLLRCGGIVGRGSFSRRICGKPFILPPTFPADWKALVDLLKPHGWVLALASVGKQGSYIDEKGKLRVNGDAVMDPLCPSCAAALVERMQSSSS